ncbi:MAG TPA: hypothetical protein VGE53_02500 [Candidatus Paceibacterota bacterium]
MNSKFETLPRKVFTNIFIEPIQISDMVREVIVRITRMLGDFMQDIIVLTVRLEWHDGRWRRIGPCY